MTVDEDWGELRPIPPDPLPANIPPELAVAVAVYEAEMAEIAPLVDAWKAKFVGTRFESSPPVHYSRYRFSVSNTVVNGLLLGWQEKYPEFDPSTLRRWAIAHVWYERAVRDMHPIQQLAARVRYALPSAATQLAEPVDRDRGVWTLDVYYRDMWLLVVSQKGHYTLGFDEDVPGEEFGYNPINPRFIFADIDLGVEFALRALRAGALPADY